VFKRQEKPIGNLTDSKRRLRKREETEKMKNE
jgi:hypothetical protein